MRRRPASNGFSEMMSKEMYGPVENKKYREYIEDIHCAGMHLLAMVEDTLDIVSAVGKGTVVSCKFPPSRTVPAEK